MIEVPNPLDEPEGFDAKCRKKGQKWLKNNPSVAYPKSFWSPFRLALAAGFSDRCGYGAMWISSGTVDHHISIYENRELAYEWNNYRYVEGWINSSKNRKRVADLLDPFEVEDGWFAIELPSLQLVLTDKVPEHAIAKARHTLQALPLQHDERIVRVRRQWLEMYEEGTPLDVIRKKAPLIAEAIERQGWLRKKTAWPDEYAENSTV